MSDSLKCDSNGGIALCETGLDDRSTEPLGHFSGNADSVLADLRI